MSSYTPVPLPYFAPAHTLPAPLPTLEEVLSSTRFLAPPLHPYATKRMNIVRVSKYFVAKYGEDVTSIEGENMLFVKQHTTIPVPQVYAIYTFGEGKTMLITEFIRGSTLEKCMIRMSPEHLDPIMEQLRAQIDELRRIPAPDYYGSIGRRPFLDPYTARRYGPFDTITDFISAFFDTLFPPKGTQRFDDIKKFFSASLESIATAQGHIHPVFSHGDLHELNIIVQRDGTPRIIDYETSGFYPAYHEYLMTQVLHCQFDILSEKFPDEDQIDLDLRRAWYRAERDERFEELGTNEEEK
ncbi:kinase-like domain-containing protein [Ustulina deusta]|nr:kinase-like domain-containing protein [Ustulina deusta]